MKFSIFLFVICVISSFSFSQDVTVYFVSNQHELSSVAKQVLDQFKAEAIESPSGEISLIGHTDRDGNTTYNDILSKKRSSAVAKYLRSIGVNNQLNIDWKGETQIVATERTDRAKASNRRVQIYLKDENDQAATIFTEFRKDPESQSASSSSETILSFKNGTQVTIRPEDLALKDSRSPIHVSVEEYYKKVDFVLANLTTTTTEGELLESKGMIHIELSQNGQPLQLKAGKSISINFPDRTEDDGTVLFSGVEHNTVITWEEQGVISSSSSWLWGASYMFDENRDTVWVTKSSIIIIANKRMKETVTFEKGVPVRTDTTSFENELFALETIEGSTKLGWINCDKFYNSDAEKVDFIVELPKGKDAHVLLVFEGMNSVISYSQKIRNQYVFNNIPNDMKVEVIALIPSDELIGFGRKEATTNDGTFVLSELKDLAKSELSDALSGL